MSANPAPRMLLFVVGPLVGVLLVGGCNRGPDIVEVQGTMTRKGKPLPGFAVTFQPASGRPSVGQTDQNGHFEMGYTFREKGVLRGKHKVFVLYVPVETTYDAKGAPADLKEITEKYGSYADTPLEVEITGPTKDLKIELD